MDSFIRKSFSNHDQSVKMLPAKLSRIRNASLGLAINGKALKTTGQFAADWHLLFLSQRHVALELRFSGNGKVLNACSHVTDLIETCRTIVYLGYHAVHPTLPNCTRKSLLTTRHCYVPILATVNCSGFPHSSPAS